MQTAELTDIVISAIEELKGNEIKAIDVREISSFTDMMLIASGTSTRHVKALADKVVEACKRAGVRPLGVEGERDAEWVLIDLGDVVVHIMLPAIRDFYNLEKLWEIAPANRRHSKHGAR